MLCCLQSCAEGPALPACRASYGGPVLDGMVFYAVSGGRAGLQGREGLLGGCLPACAATSMQPALSPYSLAKVGPLPVPSPKLEWCACRSRRPRPLGRPPSTLWSTALNRSSRQGAARGATRHMLAEAGDRACRQGAAPGCPMPPHVLLGAVASAGLPTPPQAAGVPYRADIIVEACDESVAGVGQAICDKAEELGAAVVRQAVAAHGRASQAGHGPSCSAPGCPAAGGCQPCPASRPALAGGAGQPHEWRTDGVHAGQRRHARCAPLPPPRGGAALRPADQATSIPVRCLLRYECACALPARVDDLRNRVAGQQLRLACASIGVAEGKRL